MSEATVKPKRVRRTNAQILADNIEREKGLKRVRRTKAQIAADELAEAKRREELADKRAAHLKAPRAAKFDKTVTFKVDNFWAFGYYWPEGHKIRITEDAPEYELSFDKYNNFIYGLTAEEQIAEWGFVKYEVTEN